MPGAERAGKDVRINLRGAVQRIKCVELALSNGIDNIFGYLSGIETGDPAEFKNFDDLWNAYDAQMRHFIAQMDKGMSVLDRAIAENVPSPFASAMIDGCLDKGIDLTAGGAIYNSTGVQLMGFANIVDSLFAVKKGVFEENRCTMAELAAMLSDDWQDADETRAYFLRRIPKYGNDNDEVDAMAIRVMDHYCDVLAAHSNLPRRGVLAGNFLGGLSHLFRRIYRRHTRRQVCWRRAGQRDHADDGKRDQRAHRAHELGGEAPRNARLQRRQPEHALSGKEDEVGAPHGAGEGIHGKGRRAGSVQHGRFGNT
jgi:hypothetical protein